jgi:DNA-binding IclR family transcriptional regulator
MTAAELVGPHLQELADEVGGAAGLAVRDGPYMRFIARCESNSQLLMSLRVGSRVPIATSALGWAYLAGLSGPEREALVAETKPDSDTWRQAEAAFTNEIVEFPKKGFVLNDRIFHPGYVTVALPIRGPSGRPVFSLNCGGSVSAAGIEALVEGIAPRLRKLGQLLEAIVPEEDQPGRSPW